LTGRRAVWNLRADESGLECVIYHCAKVALSESVVQDHRGILCRNYQYDTVRLAAK